MNLPKRKRRLLMNCPICDIQHKMYLYINSTFFYVVKRVYLENRFVMLYMDVDFIEELRRIDSFDHRLLKMSVNYLAFVFRCKFYNCEINKELFEPSEKELEDFFESKYVDTFFLDRIDPEYWYLCKKWYEFLETEVEKNFMIVRYLGEALFLYADSESQKKWQSSYKSGDYIREHYKELPWGEYANID